jgi:ABC-type branched-subunit amino acid transport system substrate-binding protein
LIISYARIYLLFFLLTCLVPARAEILVGFAGPMTGPRAWSGQQFERGAEQAVADLNAAGGAAFSASR